MPFEALTHRAAPRQPARLEHRALETSAIGRMAGHQVELVGMALQSAHELHGIAALGEHPVEGAVEGYEIAVEGAGDHVVDADGRGVAQYGERVVEGDGRGSVALLVEQELLDLAAALAAIAAQPVDHPVERIGLDSKPASAGGALDQPFEGGFAVHIAG